MRNVDKKLLNSWFQLLNGNLANSVPIYIVHVDKDAPDNYVWLYVEGETDIEKNSSTWIKSVTIVCQIVTKFNAAINPDTASDIDNEIGVLLADGPYHNHNLPSQTGMIINSVEVDSTTNLQEDDGTYKIYRKVTRYNHSITIQS